jgi:AcrR family transcriptional regulator
VSAPSPTRRGAARHSELLDALVDLLLAEGFAHLTLDELAGRLRCSKRTLYALAGSKEQLVRAAVVHFFERATTRVEAAVAAVAAPPDRVAAYLRAVAAELAPASARFFDDMAAFPPAAEVYARNTEAAARRVGDLIREGVAAGAFREVPVSFAAEVITATMVAIQQRRIAGTTGLADAEAYEALATLLLHGLARD